MLPVHIEDIELSYQSLVYAAVLQRMNGIISRFFLAFTCRKKKEEILFIFIESVQQTAKHALLLHVRVQM